MSEYSAIEWTDASWNFVRGCVKISKGCQNCYAETFAERFRGVPGSAYEQGFDPRLAADQLTRPLRWLKPKRIFVNSMSDLFADFVPFEYAAVGFGVMAGTRWRWDRKGKRRTWHTYQALTKRAERMAEFIAWAREDMKGQFAVPAIIGHAATYVGRELKQQHFADILWKANIKSAGDDTWPLSNVHLGVSVEDRKHGLPRIEHLRKTPAAVRFLSIEPQLEDLGDLDLTGIHWVIVGGESGHGARPFNLAWALKIKAQCAEQRVPFFFKQAGHAPVQDDPEEAGAVVQLRLKSGKGSDLEELPEALRVREMPALGAAP